MADKVGATWTELDTQAKMSAEGYFNHAMSLVIQSVKSDFGYPNHHLSDAEMSFSEMAKFLSVAKDLAKVSAMEYQSSALSVLGDRIDEGCEKIADAKKYAADELAKSITYLVDSICEHLSNK